MPDTALIAIGGYTMRLPHASGASRGIEIAAFDTATGALQSRHIVAGPRNPSYLCLSPARDKLYAVEELEDADAPHLHTYALDRTTGTLTLLSRVRTPGSFACHISVDDSARFLFASNYVSGDLVCYRLVDGIPQPDPQVIVRPGEGTARVHCAIMAPDGETLLVCDAGNDIVAGYRLTAAGLDPEPILEIAAAKGSFPRHVALVPGAATALVAHEYGSTLGIFSLSGRAVKQGADISSLPAGWSGKNSGAGVRVHPNGRFGYMSNRGDDSIFVAAIDSAALSLSPVGATRTGGRTPRDFALSPDGKWLLAANQDSDDLTVLAVDAATGALSPTGHRLVTGCPTAVLFL